ncbi:uncharacterized protein LOC143580055 [Bidens hawaiensis]|uniref:uncharacterized protein LOC143580055 n=1 Tax=Bidens hawaiensis TaxID=980011 RepID=UPI00404B533F
MEFPRSIKQLAQLLSLTSTTTKPIPHSTGLGPYPWVAPYPTGPTPPSTTRPTGNTTATLAAQAHITEFDAMDPTDLSNAFAAMGTNNEEGQWHMDTDATSHVTGDQEACRLATGHNYSLYRAEFNHEYIKYPYSGAIKRISSGQDSYTKEEFYREIEILMSVEHPNIVTLFGFCDEGSEMTLLIDDVSNGNLAGCLKNVNQKRNLTWEKRLKICIDVAHALNYLHSEMEDKKIIINRCIGSINIRLDANWGAKIIELGFSIDLPPYVEDDILRLDTIIGLPYTIDPVYAQRGKLKRASDVYSFGVLLFEILCGRTADDPIYLEKNENGLAPLARRSYSMGTLETMIDPMIKGENGENNFVLNRGPNKDSLHTFIEIAYKCLLGNQHQRPTMEVIIQELEKALSLQKNKDNPIISLEDVKVATQNFHDCIGRGGYGIVYKGNLRDGDGFKAIVAKQLDKSSDQGEQQFLSELQILLEYKHENVIGLVGYCNEKDEKIIVYEYASRGSLDNYLHDVSLTWLKRLNICIEVACALDFLHGGVEKRAKVIHRDIKTANILLNDDWKAKIADFGLSLISPITQETNYVIDYACGTPGYMDPLYRKSKYLTMESDIYSFGVVLFEILCGRSTFAIHEHEGCYLPEFVENKFKERKHEDLVFKQIREQIGPKSLTIFQTIAYQCLHHEREKRPTAKKGLKRNLRMHWNVK